MGQNHNNDIPPRMSEEIAIASPPKLQNLENQTKTIYRYEVSNLVNKRTKFFVRDNTIKLANLKLDTQFDCIVETRTSRTDIKQEDANENALNTFSYDEITIKTVGYVEEIPENFYVYTFSNLGNDLQANTILSFNHEFYINSKLDNSMIIDINDEKIGNTFITLTNLEYIKYTKNAQIIFCNSRLGNRDGIKVKSFELNIPPDSFLNNVAMKGFFQYDGQYKLNDVQVVSNDVDKIMPLWLRVNKADNYIEFYLPWFDNNFVIPYLVIAQFGTVQATTLNTSTTGMDDDVVQLLEEICLYSAIYLSGFNMKNIPQSILDAFKANSNNLNLVIDNLLDSYTLKNPTWKSTDDYWKLKGFICALSRSLISKYAIAGGNNDLNEMLLPWYLDLQTPLPRAGDDVGQYFDQDGIYPATSATRNPPKRITLEVLRKSNIFNFDPTTNAISSKITKYNKQNIIKSLDRTYTWKNLDNPLKEANFSTLASDIGINDKQYLEYFVYFNNMDPNPKPGNIFQYLQAGLPITKSFKIKGKDLNDTQILESITFPNNAINKIVISKQNIQIPEAQDYWTCGGANAPEVDSTANCSRGEYPAYKAPKHYIRYVQTDYMVGTYSYELIASTLQNPNDKIFDRNEWSQFVKTFTPNFEVGYQKYDFVLSGNSSTTYPDSINSIEIKGIFSGNMFFKFQYSDGTIESFGIEKWTALTKDNIFLFDTYNESTTITTIDF